jgi:hypothetical protein
MPYSLPSHLSSEAHSGLESFAVREQTWLSSLTSLKGWSRAAGLCRARNWRAPPDTSAGSSIPSSRFAPDLHAGTLAKSRDRHSRNSHDRRVPHDGATVTWQAHVEVESPCGLPRLCRAHPGD